MPVSKSFRQPKPSVPTMSDVAFHAGVSQATVSLVLNNSPGAKLSERTRKRVQLAAKELGYKLASRAARKSSGSTPVIVFIVDEVATDPWMAIGFDHARRKAAEFGYSVYLAVASDDSETEAAILEQFAGPNLLGIIYGTILTRRVEPAAAILKHPTVLLNCYDAGRKLHSIIPGDLLGGRVATERLIDAGHTRIGFINGQQGTDGARDRLKGYRQALSSNDIPFDPALVRSGTWEPISGYEETKLLLALNPRPTAIFCANDLMAQGCYDALHEAGLTIPGDISVIGFDNRELALGMHPPLTTLILPHGEMAAIAVETLVDQVNGHNTKPIQIKVECELVERNSI